jgi:hypothetical protein
VKRIKGFARYMVDNGLLFEINRKVLHPLGLALVADVDYDNPKYLRLDGLYKIDDPEGFQYDPETFDVNKETFQKFLDKEGNGRLASRKRILGYIIQGETDDADQG